MSFHIDYEGMHAAYRRGWRGRDWYARMRELLADRYEDVECAAAAMAACSAGMGLQANTVLADRCYTAWKKGPWHWARVRLIGGHRKSFEHWTQYGVLKGPKVEAFRRAILGDDDAVVVDRWMMRAAGMGVDRPTRAMMEAVTDGVQRVAAVNGSTAVCTQARIWCGIRKGTSFPLITRLFWRL